jgi:hypothetical protein
VVVGRSELEDRRDDQEQERQDEGELDERLSALVREAP